MFSCVCVCVRVVEGEEGEKVHPLRYVFWEVLIMCIKTDGREGGSLVE